MPLVKTILAAGEAVKPGPVQQVGD